MPPPSPDAAPLPTLDGIVPSPDPAKRGPGRPRSEPTPTTQAGGTTPGTAGRPKADTGPKGSSRGPGRPPNQPKLVERIQTPFTAIGTTLALSGRARGNEVLARDGILVIEHGENIAKALDQLCAENPKVRKAIEKMLEGSAWGGVVMAVGGLGFAIAENHGLSLNPMSLFREPDDDGTPAQA